MSYVFLSFYYLYTVRLMYFWTLNCWCNLRRNKDWLYRIVLLYLKKKGKNSKSRTPFWSHYISEIISKFHENWPNKSPEKHLQRSELKPKHFTRKSDLKFFRASVFVDLNAFALHTGKGCYPITLEHAIWHSFPCAGKEQAQFVRN